MNDFTKTIFTNAEVEQTEFRSLFGLGLKVAYGPGIGPNTPNTARENYLQVG